MSSGTQFPVENDLKSSVQNSSKTLRFVIAGINNETLVLIKTIESSSTVQNDFDNLASQIDSSKPCFILLKEKQWGPSNWVFISYIPDSAPVQQRTIYGSAIMHLRQQLGNELFGSEKRFSDISEVNWSTFKGFETSSSTSDKPWSKRELAQQELDAAEAVARAEASSQPLPASGFHTVTYPLTDEAKTALSNLTSKSVNWVQLSLDESRKNLTSVASKSVTSSELSGLIDSQEPQFYLYNYSGNTLVLIYCCPEKAPLKNRMVYSTCKSSLADTLKSSGVSVVKKYDIQSPTEMNESSFSEAMRSSSSSMFKPSVDGHVKSSSAPMEGYRAGFDSRTFSSDKPVFNRPGFKQPSSSTGGSSSSNIAAKSSAMKSPAPLAQAMGLSSSSNKKNIVIPPKAAYQ